MHMAISTQNSCEKTEIVQKMMRICANRHIDAKVALRAPLHRFHLVVAEAFRSVWA